MMLMKPVRPRRILAVVGAKLISADTILPLLLQLKAEQPDSDIRLLFLDNRWRSVVEDNYVLGEATHALHGVHRLSDGTGTVINRLGAGLRLAWWLGWLWRRPSLVLCYDDFAHFPFNLMAWAARAGSGRAVLYVKPPYAFSDALRRAQGDKVGDKDVRFRDGGDCFLTFHPEQTKDFGSYTDKPATVIGAPHRFPEWTAHVDRMARERGVIAADGSVVVPDDRPVFVMFYPGDAKVPTCKAGPRAQFRLFLEVLRREAPQVRLLLKPHPICNFAQMYSDLAEFPELDVIPTFCHAQVLARFSRLAIFPNGSTVINDMYVEGVPVLDIGDYQDEFTTDPLFPNAGRMAAVTPEAIAAAIRLAVATPERLPAPDPEPLCWPKPDRLFDAIFPQPSAQGRLSAATPVRQEKAE